MFKTGLVSISFRNLSPEEIVKMVAEAKLDAIEWGGDVHVSHGDMKKAEEVRKLTVNAGLECSSYGSYYRLGAAEKEEVSFISVLDSAEALGTPIIRVWAGNKASADADQEYRRIVMDDAVRIANLAEKRNIEVALEYHGGSLTDTNESAQKLMRELDHNNISTYWQPPNYMDFTKRLSGLKEILSHVSNIHVFHWQVTADGIERRPLEEGAENWQQYLQTISTTNKDHYALLEFFKDDAICQFQQDADSLKKMLLSL